MIILRVKRKETKAEDYEGKRGGGGDEKEGIKEFDSELSEAQERSHRA